MKVKVSYTVDFDEVPQLVNDIIEDCRHKLLSICNSKKLVFSPQVSDMTNKIGEIQNEILLVESKLQDVVNIANGWMAAHSAEDEQEPAQGASESLSDERLDE